MLNVKIEFWLKFFNLETTQAGKFYPEYNVELQHMHMYNCTRVHVTVCCTATKLYYSTMYFSIESFSEEGKN